MVTRLSLWLVSLLLLAGFSSQLLADDTESPMSEKTDAPAEVEAKQDDAKPEDDAEKAPTEGEGEHAEKDHDPEKGHDDKDHGHDKPDHDNGAHGEGDHEDGDHGHHDPFDLSHNDATSSLNAPEEVTWGLATYSFFVFLGLVLVLSAFAWKPIMSALDEREKAMDGKIAEAQKMFADAEERLAEYNQKLTEAQQEIQQSREQAMREADEKRQQIISEAKETAKAETERAKLEINAAKSQAIDQVTQQSVNLAVDLAGKIVRRQLNAEDHAQLINEAMSQLPSKN